MVGFKFKEHPTWGMIVAMMAMFFVLTIVGAGVMQSVSHNVDQLSGDVAALQDGQEAARERGYINRSISCMQVIVDNDRTFPLTGECTDQDVAAYYPNEVCEQLPVVVPGCGSKAQAG